jgi:hypothetical protein
MNQKQHEQLNVDTFKNKYSLLDPKAASTHVEQIGLLSNICLNPNESQSQTSSKKQVHLNVNNLMTKKSLENFDSLLFENEIKLEDTKAHYPIRSEACSESFDQSYNQENLIASNSSYLRNCFTNMYSDKELNEKYPTNTENLKRIFEKTCLFTNRNVYNDKGSEFRHYKNNIIRRASRTSMSEIMSAHQAIRAFQNKEDKENNLKYNAPKKAALKAKVYNFLERPSGWLCFIYHFTV